MIRTTSLQKTNYSGITGSCNKYQNTKFNVGYYHFCEIAYMVRSCVGPFDFECYKEYDHKYYTVEKYLAYLLGVMEWHYDNYISNQDDSPEINADRFVKFIKFYTINILLDHNGYIFDKLVQLITNCMYSSENEDGYKAADNFHNNKNIFAGS